MSDGRTINVKGPSGGTYKTANTAVIVHNGMGNTTNKEGARYKANRSNIGQMGANGKAIGTTFAESKQAEVKDPDSMTSVEVLEEMRKAEVTQKTQEIFKANNVTGVLFLDGDLEDLLKDLEITDKLDIRKLKVLRKKLEDPDSMTSVEVLEEMRKAEVTQKTQKIFKANNVTGALFLDGDLEDLLKDLEITDKLDIRKLKVLRKKLEGK